MENRKVGFLAFFLIWAKQQGWKVPLLHVRVCHWLETCDDPVRVLQVFRGAAKSTIYAVFKAWCLYCNPNLRSLIWSADGPLSKKLTRDVINVLRRHPLCAGILPTKPGAQMFWVNGANDPRNASMTAVGVDQNVTSARADSIDYDDVEVPKNIRTPEARENLRLKIQEATFILVPGGQETYIGTLHRLRRVHRSASAPWRMPCVLKSPRSSSSSPTRTPRSRSGRGCTTPPRKRSRTRSRCCRSSKPARRSCSATCKRSCAHSWERCNA
ncbi:hypothetical protein BTRA_3087 [Burkholderia thailandensis USAMRU Malaysia |uniref:phage terminase large subunit n=1 Tax=Burkholderia thailandensis TaxID=57975 RepID=UPI0003EC9BA5|nr:phage terminase large subunit [Burkholderia thailandensis]AHI80290.1 hypothetical protein BTJ_1494 [Burkholderia thailandensis E444]AIC88910.1 hypothetical protein BTRA_3087 [Burkholderia thailandensis USAMRU Malaysia \